MGLRTLITRTTDTVVAATTSAARAVTAATTSAAGATGGAALGAGLGAARGAADGLRNGAERGSRSAPAAALTVTALTGSCSLLAPVAPAVVPTFSATTTTPAPVVPVKAGLPTRCKDLLNGQQLDAVLGLPLSSVVRTVLGQPSPSVGLNGRITCSYGIPSPSGGYASSSARKLTATTPRRRPELR